MGENKKVSQLDQVLSANGTEFLMVIQEIGGVFENKKIAVRDLKNVIDELDTGRVRSVKCSITSEQLLNVGSNPVVLINAPGNGKKIQLLNVSSRYNPGSEGYINYGLFQLFYSNTYDADIGENLTSISGFAGFLPLLDTTPYCQWLLSENFTNDTSGQGYTLTHTPENQSILLAVDDRSDPQNGNGTLDIYITYQIVDL